MIDEKMNIKEKIEALRSRIEECSDAYYNQDAPIVTDEEYDRMMHELKKLEEDHPEYASETSPTNIVGGKRVIGIPVDHKVPMLSLVDVFTEEDVAAFVDQVHDEYPDAEFAVEEKIDGLSLSLVYEDGKLVQASTRGDGHIGEDVTANVMALPTVPKKLYAKTKPDVYARIMHPKHLELRAECYMSQEDFDKTNKKQLLSGQKLFANPRNCAAGTLRQANPAVAAERNLQIIVFNVQEADQEFMELTHTEQKRWLYQINAGFETTRIANGTSPDEVISHIRDIGDVRASLPYPIDGAVVKIDRLDIRKAMGDRTKTPRWAIAFKYPPEERSTMIKEIRLQTGRTGRVTPVAIFDPIQLAGTTVQRATLNNQAFIDALDIRIGSTVVVRKAAEIIPQITMVEKDKQPAMFSTYKITNCPACGAPVASIDGSVDLFCTNDLCPAKAESRLVHFASRPCMDIKGLGETILHDLYEKEIVKVPPDIYDLKNKPEIVDMFGEKIVQKLLAAIEDSKKQKAEKVMKGLGWKDVGNHVSSALLNVFGSIDAIFNDPKAKDAEYLKTIDGIGADIAESIVKMVSDANMQAEVKRLKEYGLNMKWAEKQSNTLEGLTFVITGTLPSLGREEAAALIKANGGKVSGSVSKNTKYLLCGENAGSKLTKAQELGVTVISEQDLYTMLDS